jgi:hypothetical protein
MIIKMPFFTNRQESGKCMSYYLYSKQAVDPAHEPLGPVVENKSPALTGSVEIVIKNATCSF